MISLLEGAITQRWQPVALADIVVGERQRSLSSEHVAQIRASYAQLGGQLQLQPIVLDEKLGLIDGAHRLEAAKQAGWTHITALVLEGITDMHRPILEAEANRVRKNLTPVELEAVWRSHYEPAFKVQARQRQLAGLRRGTTVGVSVVIENSDSGVQTSGLTMAKAAKQTTGLSLETLNKIAEVRQLSKSQRVPSEVREAAVVGLRKLARPNAQVASVHRQLMSLLQQLTRQRGDAEQQRLQSLESTLERTLSDTSMLAERLAASLARDLEDAARIAETNREILRAVRVSLVRSLATVVSVECRLDDDPLAALKRIGPEVSRLQTQTSMRQLGVQVQHG